MAEDGDEWVRLPGLFRWEEVCDVFARHAGIDDHWRFEVRKVTGPSSSAALFIVYAAPSDVRAPAEDGAVMMGAARRRGPE
jgi:hypothetical protein